MSESEYKVVWPLGKSAYKTVSLKSRIVDLRGKTICELSHSAFRDQEVRPLLREALSKRYPGIKFVEYSDFGNIHGPKEDDVIATLPTKLREYGCDAVISGIGA